MLLITSIIAAVLTIIFIKLSFAVIGLRRKNKVGLGSGGHEDLERAIRAQGNFAEYVPFGIILIARNRTRHAEFLPTRPVTAVNYSHQANPDPSRVKTD